MLSAQSLQNAYNLHRAGRLDEAERHYRDVLTAEPQNFDALYLLGTLYSQTGRFDEALQTLSEATRIKPDAAEAAYARAMLLHRLGRLEEAVAAYDRFLLLQPRIAEAHNNRGAALSSLERHAEALASYDAAITIKPDFAGAWNNRGNAYLLTGHTEEAVKNYDRALALNPRQIDALVNRGTALVQLARQREAVASFSAALALEPNRLDVIEARGRALSDLHLYEEALPDLERAVAAAPDRPDVLYNRANAYSVLKRYKEAVRDAEKALAADPDYPFARGLAVYSKIQICDWSGLDAHLAALSEAVKMGRNAASPFELLAVSTDPEEPLRAAKLWGEKLYPQATPLWREERYQHDRIRIAYLSADYRDHPVAFQMAGIFETHDRSAFETFAISFTPEYRSPLRTRLEQSCEHFLDVREKSDFEIAQLLRAKEVDIAVDLMGYTRECRTGIFSHRPAPVQVNYLGYPGTMGLAYFDYIIADPVVIPAAQHKYFSEKIVSLSGSFFPNDGKRARPATPPTRTAAGLPEEGFVFCCFNGAYKIGPKIFGAWMRLLRAVDGSVLWLSHMNATAVANLRNCARLHGVDPDRLVFAPFVDASEQHLERLSLADLFLDSLPYGAHATACDALWAGVPVLAAPGSTFAGRVAASLVTAAGAPELVPDSLDAYETTAIRLARDDKALQTIRRNLGERRWARLFNTENSCRDLEAAFRAMWQRSQRGDPPEDFSIPEQD